MSITPDLATAVTVLGLGAMGRALAGAFLDHGHPTTVWNRTPGRATALADRGAAIAVRAADAVAASPLTVICLLDDAAVRGVIEDLEGDLAGSTLVNLTSSTPDGAAATAALATKAGARYLDGKIMVPTPLIGTDDALILYSGDGTVFDEHHQLLAALGGEANLLGEDIGLAAIYDLALLDVFFNGMVSFLHATALVGSEGVSATRFLPYADRIVSVLQGTMVELAAEVDRGEHPGDADNLEMELRALDHIVGASESRGLDMTVPELPRSLVRAAISAGHGRDGFSRVIDSLRPPSTPSHPPAR
ncbi:NAD(P)-dependent oxidoreductase [soil metagenome]